MTGAGPRLGCLPPGWIMISAGSRQGLGLGHRLVESVDARALGLDDNDPSGWQAS